jgi:hypothetical protein
VIALLGAASGLTAIRDMLRRRVKVSSTLGFEESGYYEVARRGDVLRIMAQTAAWPEPSAVAGAAPLRPTVLLNFRNERDDPVTVDAVELSFSSLEPLDPAPPPAIIVTLAPGADWDAVRRTAERLGLALDEATAGAHRYVANDAERTGAELAAQLARDDSVADAFPDAAGQADTPWVATEPVNLNLRTGKREYSHRVGHTVAGHDAITIPLTLGSNGPLRGRGKVTVRYLTDRSDPAGELDLELRFPSFVRTVEQKGAGFP